MASWIGWGFIDSIKRTNGKHSEFLKALSENQHLNELVKEFYKQHFWDVIWGDELALADEKLAIDMFDMSVNLGSGRATEFMQRACNILNRKGELYPDIVVDNSFGPQTIRAFKSCIRYRGAETLYKVINILQGSWYVSLMERNEKFEKYIGWFKRVDFIQ